MREKDKEKEGKKEGRKRKNRGGRTNYFSLLWRIEIKCSLVN